uniref:DNA helicase n=1 Tax=Steinernema glaseri TaxID=37863 RepID=A0A1I8A9M9_9BILA
MLPLRIESALFLHHVESMYRRVRSSDHWKRLPSQESTSPKSSPPPASPASNVPIDPKLEDNMPSTPSRESSEATPATAPATRERRSKANSNKAWASLMPAKRGKNSDDEEEPEAPKAATATPSTRGAAKRTRAKKTSPVPAKQAKKESPPPPLTPQSDKGEGTDESGATMEAPEELVPDHDTGMIKLSKMEEGYFDEEEMEDDEDSHDYFDDPNDEDFGAESMTPPKKAARGKAGAKATATPAARGSRSARGGVPTPQSRAKVAPRAVPASPATGSGPTSLSAPALRTVTSTSGPIVVSRNATTVLSSTGKPLKIVKLNGTAVRGARLVGQRIVTTTSAPSVPASGDAPTTSAAQVSIFRPVSGGSGDDVVSSMASSVSKEVSEITQKFKDRVIPGHSVAEFNKIIDTLKGELIRVTEDRQRMAANHRETVDQMQLNHSTLIDIKESRIRQLEQQVEQLQKKLQTSVDNHLIQLLGNESSTNV